MQIRSLSRHTCGKLEDVFVVHKTFPAVGGLKKVGTKKILEKKKNKLLHLALQKQSKSSEEPRSQNDFKRR